MEDWRGTTMGLKFLKTKRHLLTSVNKIIVGDFHE